MPRQTHLRVMSTTDLHVHILPYDYYTDGLCETVGLARTASLIAQARAGAANCLLLDNGDFLQGNPMGDQVVLSGLATGGVHPLFAAMNALGYDAATLGNHEFNYGLDFLLGALEGAAFPTVSANVALHLGAGPRTDRMLLQPYVILDRWLADASGQRQPIRIGVIGFTPPQIVQWDRAHLEGRVFTRDIVESAAALVPQMQEEGCDLIIALSHSGIGAPMAHDRMENASVPLARLVGIDALVTGHSHQVFPSPMFHGLADVDAVAGRIAGKPAVMAGFWGSHLGVIDLLLEREAGRWRVLDSRSEARPIWNHGADGKPKALVASDQTVVARVAKAHQDTLAYARRPIGQTRLPLHSFFAMVAPAGCVALVAEAQAAHVQRMLAGTAHAGLPLLSAAAPFKTGGRGGATNFTVIPPGELALRHAADIYIYPNTITALKLTGAEIIEWLERAAGQFCQLVPGLQDQPLIDPDFPSYNFDLIHGLTFAFDLSQPARYSQTGQLIHPAARRITDLRYQGAAVALESEFIVATNNFRASGSGGFPTGETVWQCSEHTRDILMRHIGANSPLAPEAGAFWRFCPMPGTSAAFETAPEAASHLPGSGLPVVMCGPAPLGFGRFRLTL